MAIDRKLFRRRSLAAITLALSASLAVSALAACATTTTNPDDEEEESTSTRTDTQTLRNGNFEFYPEMDEETSEKRDLINTPDSWSFTSGSPTSDTKSGVVDVTEWSHLSKSGSAFFAGLKSFEDDEDDERADYFDSIVSDVVAHWEDDDVTAYDRLKFFDMFEEEIDDLASDSEAAELFADYDYTVDFNDVEYLSEVTPAVREGRGEDVADETSMLMIHNHRTESNVEGTGQYYTSSTSISLDAGTAAKVSVWVRTDKLTHYYAPEEGKDPVEVAGNAGAYVRVNRTAGGGTLDPFYMENINTKGEWQKYTFWVRANSFTASSFTVVLGLGQGSSDQREHYVNGYAFFDDITCEIVSEAEYESAVASISAKCDLDSKDQALRTTDITAAIDLDADFGQAADLTGKIDDTMTVGITKDPDGGKSNVKYEDTYSDDYAQAVTFGTLKSNNNSYLKNVINGWDDSFPFNEADADNMLAVMLMSVSGAPYTAKSGNFTLDPDKHMIVSFWVKTSEIGGTGASATVVDGSNRTQIAAFDTTTADPVDIDDDTKDIYNGWVRCFFFISNNTDSAKTFHLEFSYGPTDVATAEASAYDDGYAAFTGFEVYEDVAKKHIDRAESGTYAQKVTLTGAVDNDSAFDTEGVGSSLSEGLAHPHSFRPLANGSSSIIAGSSIENTLPAGLYTGLLSYKYAENYKNAAAEQNAAAWATALNTIAGTASTVDAWWTNIFGDRVFSNTANQPLVFLNTSNSSVNAYGYQTLEHFTVAADSYQRISMRVKLSEGATATIYLLDTSDVKKGYNDRLTPTLPAVTFWYDDNGNILKGDPDKAASARDNVLFYREDNGLFTKAGANDGTYYANLQNYDKDDAGNLVAVDADGNTTIAFYADNGKFYAYREEVRRGEYKYSQEVTDIFESLSDEEKGCVRYDYTKIQTSMTPYESAIQVTGTKENAGRWIDVSFYIHTGNTAKNYLLEVWAGSRDYEVERNEKGEVTNVKPTGTQIPANGYVFFDNYTSTDVSETYADLLAEKEDELKRATSTATDANLPSEYALYYTFTFYDAKDYLRYDASLDEDGLGDPYGSYTQSSYSESLAALRFSSSKAYGADLSERFLEESLFLDYATADVTVTADDLTEDDDNETDEETPAGDTNVWLIVSSSLLAFALVFAIVAIIVRRILKKTGRHAKIKPVKEKRVRKKKDAPAETPVKEEAPEDENDPYNE